MIVHLFNSSVVSGPETLAIPALKRLGEDVAIVFLNEVRLGEKSLSPEKYARDLGHQVYSVPVRSRWDKQAFRELREVLDSIGARIVHAHDVKASLYLLKASRVAPGFKSRLVSTHHGAAARHGIIRLYEEIYVRWALPKFDSVLAVCEGDRKSLLRRGVPERTLHVHYNGVDRPLVAPKDRRTVQREIRARWKMLAPTLPDSDQAVFMGAVARLSEEKRHDRMLRTLAQVLREKPGLNPVLVCFGNGALEADLKKQTRLLGLEKNVFWMGYSKSISQEIAGFDLLLCLSDGEGIPINLLEAGWAGTPVLSTSVGGIPDLLNSAEVGFLVDKRESDTAIGHQMAEVLADGFRRDSVGRAFQDRVVEKFSEKAWLDELRRVYSTLK